MTRTLLAAGFLVAAGGLRHSPGLLLVHNVIHEGEVRIATGQTWLGLFPGPDRWQLSATTVRVVLLDTVCGRSFRVEAGRSPAPLFLVRDVGGLTAGAVVTVDTALLALRPGQNHAFRLAGASYRVSATGDDVARLRNYALKLVRVSDGRSQDLVANYLSANADGIDWPPRIRWIGDLDRDGRPDLLMDVHMYETPEHWVLFLSGHAGQGRLVQVVAEHRGMDC